jgi:hypothetical protein
MKVFVSMLIIIVIILLAGCKIKQSVLSEESEKTRMDFYNKSLELVDDINENSDFGSLELLAYSDYATNLSAKIEGDNILSEPSAPEGIDGYYACYPTDSVNGRITFIDWKSDKYHIYDIKVGQLIDDAKATIEAKGFVEIVSNYDIVPEMDNDIFEIGFVSYDVGINFEVIKGSGIIKRINVSVFHDNGEMEPEVY